MQQLQAVAIGNPTVGGFVIGGANAATSLTLLNYLPRLVSRNRVGVSVDFAVQKNIDEVDDFLALVEAVQGMSKGSMSFGVTRKEAAKTINVDIDVSMGSQTVTIVRNSGDSFASTDVALPLTIDGVGSFMITSFDNTNQVTCLLAPGIAAPSPAVSLTAVIGKEFLRIDEVTKTGGFRSEVVVGEVLTDDADETRRIYRLDGDWERPANEGRGSVFAHRREASYQVLEDEAGILEFVFTGTYTAGSSNLALGNYNAGVDTWINGITSTLSSRPVKIVGKDFFATDDESGLLTFVKRRREITLAESAASTDDDVIKNANVRFFVNSDESHGLLGHNSPVTSVLDYTAWLDIDQATEAAAISYYKNTIKNHILQIAQALYGPTPVVVRSLGPNWNSDTNEISARLILLHTNSGSNIVDFEVTTEVLFNEGKTYKKRTDGKPNTYSRWIRGQEITAITTVSLTRIEDISDSLGQSSATFGINGGLSVSFGSAGSAGFPTTGALAISFGAPGGGGGDVDVASSTDVYPEPPNPPDRFLKLEPGLVGRGFWDRVGRSARKTPKFFGGRDGASLVKFSIETYVQTWRFVSRDSQDVPVRPSPQGSPRRITTVTSGERPRAISPG